MKLQEMTWPEVARLPRDRVLVLAPVAACEQHSLHLPTFTDSILCGGVADGVEAQLRDQVLLLPLLWMGASDHHFPFGATLSLPVDLHIQVLRELLTPLLDDGFQRVLLLNGHGGNIDTMHVALRGLQPRYPNCQLSAACYWDLAEKELAALAQGPRKQVGHACEIETALVMHFRPDLVRRELIKDDHEVVPDVLRGLYQAQDMGQRTHRGCVGYPEKATPEAGSRFANAAISRVAEVCRALLETPIVPGRKDRKREIL